MASPLGPGQSFVDLMPADHFAPDASWFLVYLVMGALPLATVLVARLFVGWHRRRGALADASAKENPPALEAGSVVLRGKVCFADGSDVAVTTTIEQHGTERKQKGNWSHEWKEVERVVVAEPFYLAVNSGQQVRVEPTLDVTHIDEMSATQQLDRTRRLRVATLSPDEEIFAVGELAAGHDPRATGSGYRGRASALVLRAPSRGELLLSSEPLGDRFRKRASTHHGFSIAFAVVMIACQAFAWAYHLRNAVGEASTGVVRGKRTYITRTKNGSRTHYELTVKPDEAPAFTEEVPADQYFRMHKGTVVPIIEVAGWDGRERVGLDTTVHMALPVTFIALYVLLAIAYLYVLYASRPWWERKLNESGRGRLPEPPQSG